MNRKGLLSLTAGALAALALVSLMGVTGGGFPSRPKFQSVEIRANAPVLRINDADAAVDTKLWRCDAAGADLSCQIRNDADSGGAVFLQVNRTAAALDRVRILPALWVENQGDVQLFLRNTTSAADQKNWSIEHFSPDLNIRPYDDAGSPGSGGMSMVRGTAATVQSIVFTSTDFQHEDRVSGNITSISRHCFSHKGANTTRVNTTTATADPDLQCDVAAGKLYEIEAILLVSSGSATPDFKLDPINPGANDFGESVYFTTVESGVGVITASASNGVGNWTSVFGVPITVTNVHRIHLKGLFNCNVSGTLQIGWAQNTLDAVNGVTLRAGSWFKVKPSG